MAARKLWKDTRVNEGHLRPDQAPQTGASDTKPTVWSAAGCPTTRCRQRIARLTFAMLPDVLLEIAATIELFHTATGVAFADLRIEGHRETWPVRSRRLRGWLRRRYYEETREALAAAAVRSALAAACGSSLCRARKGPPQSCNLMKTRVALSPTQKINVVKVDSVISSVLGMLSVHI